MRGLFDTISPALRPREPRDDVRDGRGLAPPRRARAAPARAAPWSLDLACGTGDFCRELARRGYRAVGFDFSHGMLVNARTEAPLVEADILTLPVRRRRRRRRHVRLRAAQRGLPRRLLPRAGRAWSGRAVAIALLDASEPDNRVLRAGHGVYFNKAVPDDRRGALRPRRVRLPAEVDGVPAAARGDGGDAPRRPGSPTPNGSSSRAGSRSCSWARGHERTLRLRRGRARTARRARPLRPPGRVLRRRRRSSWSARGSGSPSASAVRVRG